MKAITEELRGHAASSISAINKRLDESLKAFAERRPQEPFAYVILDDRYEKVREAGVAMSQAVLITVGIDRDGRRQILSAEMADRESRPAWKDFLVRLKGRSFKGVKLVVPDDHAGLVAAIGGVIPPPDNAVHALPPQRPRSPATQAWRRLPEGTQPNLADSRPIFGIFDFFRLTSH